MQSKIAAIFVLVIALIFAVVIGSNVAMGEYDSLGTYGVIAIILYFAIHGWRNVWWFTALLIFSGVVFSQGFVFEADHLFVLMLLLATVLSFVNGSRTRLPREMRLAGSGFTAAVLVLLLGYGTLHFLGNYAFPYSPHDYSLKTSLKAYFECYASMACFFWFLVGPYGFQLKGNWSRFFIAILAFAVAANLLVRFYMFYTGFQAADGLSETGLDAYVLYVPVINMQAGIYTLRSLCPIAVVILLMAATTPSWWRNQKRWVKLIVMVTVVLAMVGATFSGGRATLLLCLALAGCVGLVRRKVALISVMGMAGALLVGLANIFSYEINTHAPFYVARSLQMVMLDKGETYETIGESQNYRNAAIKAALGDWNQDNRTRFTGRSVFAITSEDAEYARNVLGMDGFISNAMRSGRTHNMVTDLLIQYGAIGFVLYLAAYLAVIRYYWRLARLIPETEGFSRSLADSMKVFLPLMLVYELLGGGYLPMISVLALGLIRANLVLRAKQAVVKATPGIPEAHAPGGRSAIHA